MGFVKSSEELEKLLLETFDFFNAEMLTVVWETKPEIVARLLPPPLKPAKRPLAAAFLANYPETNFSVAYQEGALFLMAEFNGEEGTYCLAMPVNNDMAMIGGREVFGYPKKMAIIELGREGTIMKGFIERHGVRFLEMSVNLDGTLNTVDAAEILLEAFGMDENPVRTVFNYKYFPSPEGLGFDYNPRLIREEVEFHHTVMEMGSAEITLRPSDHDPWAEVEIVRVLGALYTKGNNSMRKGATVAEVDQMDFAPYAFLKVDPY
jgi:acetoacetate decarboxylase